jgi:guanylate kinase
MKQSHFEIENFHKYDYVVVNQTNGIEKAAENILDIMKVETLRTSRNLELAENFYN